MKNLEEKKLLLKMMRAFGQDDKELAESIRREEELAEKLFGGKKVEPPVIIEETKPEPVVLKEADPPPPPAPAFTPPTTNTVIDVINVLKTANANANTNVYRDKELEGMRRTIAEMMQKISTLSWGGGGTGIVRIYDADDLDRSSVQNGRYMKYQDGYFVMDEINPFEIIHNTTLVTTNTYVVQDEDYYIGVNCPEPVTIIIPSEPSSGREIVVKDESGNCSNQSITVSGPVDNDANGFILQVDNGAVHMLFRGDYWRII
jgi:hypothetical protein